MKFLTTEEFFSRPDPGWIIRSFLPAGRLTLLDAREGAGKSRIALYTAFCVSTGHPFFDLCKVEQAGNILWCNLDMLAAKDVEDVCKEITEWYDPTDKNWTNSITWYEERLDLRDPDTYNAFIAKAKEVDAKLIVIDTLARLINDTDYDEMDSKQMTDLMSYLTKIARHTEAAVILLAHTPKDSENRSARGSSAIGASCDIEYFIDGELKEEEMTISIKKSRSSSIGHWPMTIRPAGIVAQDVKNPEQPQGAWLGILTGRIQTDDKIMDWWRKYVRDLICAKGDQIDQFQFRLKRPLFNNLTQPVRRSDPYYLNEVKSELIKAKKLVIDDDHLTYECALDEYEEIMKLRKEKT